MSKEIPSPSTDSPEQIPEPQSKDKSGSSDLEELAERLRGAENVDDNIAEFLATNWQRLLGGLAVVLLVVFVVGEARDAQSRKMGEAAQRFEQAQQVFSSVVLKPPLAEGAPAESAETLKTQQKTFEDTLTLLAESYSDSVYGKAAPLYQAAGDIKEKNFERAKRFLESYDIQRFQEKTASTSDSALDQDSFLDELASLLYARLLIEQGKSRSGEISQYLGRLVENAKFVNLEALIMLFRVSNSEEEMNAAQKAAKSLASARPDLVEMINVELGKIGIGID